MPTRDRKDFVLQSIVYFQRQDYPNLELIILDDGAKNISGSLPRDPRIRYCPVSPGLSIGSKRNEACRLARGEIIAHWDDDDWYSPERLSAQVAPLLAGTAAISALKETIFFDLPRWEFWTCTREMHRRLFVEDVHGGTLVYWKRIWQDLARYPDQSLAEDARFLAQAIAGGAPLAGLPNPDRFVYLRHGENTWSFNCGQFLDPRGWQRIAEPEFQACDRQFYAAHSPSAPPIAAKLPGAPGANSEAMVSCIMPTAGRRNFLPQAIRYFMRQDYPDRELIVVDDGDDSVSDLVPTGPRIKYLRLDRKQTIGAKRNIACQQARGQIIVHWDDDDWMAPWRIRHQVAKLRGENADICGISKPLFYDLEDDEAWQYIYPEDAKPWVYGATFCYTRWLWQRNPFLDTGRGEDTKFVWSEPPKKVLALPDTNMFVGLIHRSNTDVHKRPGNSRWHPHSIADIQNTLQGDWDYYQNLRRLNPDLKPHNRPGTVV
jgi:glycosyltransferase involved in cell wall biosynthesis